ncbi:hypothetical protein K438DRAFT_1992772 [Mycena galopus ATCC 62051]|nr:hypothetical protein K438DRAFT_1992772 [Mycena galopus ATCC 62051]
MFFFLFIAQILLAFPTSTRSMLLSNCGASLLRFIQIWAVRALVHLGFCRRLAICILHPCLWRRQPSAKRATPKPSRADIPAPDAPSTDTTRWAFCDSPPATDIVVRYRVVGVRPQTSCRGHPAAAVMSRAPRCRHHVAGAPLQASCRGCPAAGVVSWACCRWHHVADVLVQLSCCEGQVADILPQLSGRRRQVADVLPQLSCRGDRVAGILQ